jgi:hypothetical protein
MQLAAPPGKLLARLQLAATVLLVTILLLPAQMQLVVPSQARKRKMVVATNG